MEDFDGFMDLFVEAEGRPIQYKGKTLIMSDQIQLNKQFVVSIELISTNSEWRQGICMDVKGALDSGVEEIGPNHIFWQEIWTELNKGPVIIRGNTKDGVLQIYNAWDTGSGSIDYFYNGGAMIKKETGKKEYTYYCNDGHFDDDFDDIVFRLKILEGGKE